MPQRIAGFLVDVGSEMVLSILPLFMAGLNISKTWIGIIEGIAEAASTALKAVSGWVSERVEKQKPLIVIGYALSTVVKPFLALSNFWYQVLSVRFLDRIGRGERTVSRGGMVCGALLASLLLFIFADYFKMDALSQYRNIFWLSVIPAILGMLTASSFMKEARKKIGDKERGKDLFLSLSRRLKLFFFVSALFELAKFSYVFFILRAAELGLLIPLVPIIYLLYGMVYSGFIRPVEYLLERVGIRKILIVGYLLFCFAHLGFASAEGAYPIWLFFIVYGVASAIVEVAPRALIAHLTPEEKRGAAFGAYYTTIGLAALPATAIAGVLWDNFGATVSFTYGAVIALAALILFMVGIREHHFKKSAS